MGSGLSNGQRTEIMRWKKDNLQIFTSKKNLLRKLLFLEIVSVTKQPV